MAVDEPFRRYLTDADALLWNIEKDPVLRSTITAVAVLDRPPDWDRLRARVDRATRLFPRMRQHIAVPALRVGPARWLLDPDFDLDYHLRRMRVPAGGGWRDLLDLARPLGMAGFDRARPLWEATLIEGLADGGAALLLKVHHAMVDGVGGIELAGAMLLDLEREPSESPAMPDLPVPDHLGPLELTAESLAERGRLFAGNLLRRATQVTAAAPGATADEGVRAARSVAKILAPATEPLSPIMRERSLSWWFDTFDLPLHPLLAAAHAVGGTLNDAFLAGVTGALRRYHERHGVEVEELRMTMPINLRESDDEPGGNRFTPARFPVPLLPADPAVRLREIGARTRAWRHEPAIALTDTLAAVLNRLPTTMSTALFGSMLKGVDFVATNVPGSPVPVYLAGAEVTRLYALAPPSGASANFALVSHNGVCCLGLNVDLAAVPDPDVLAACVVEGFDEVLALAPDAGTGTG